MRAILILLAVVALAAGDPQAEFLERTGLQAAPGEREIPCLTGTHRGYPVSFEVAAGDVWGRYFARLALAEAGQRLPGVARLAFEEPGQGFVGSPMDRLLSGLIGHPLSLVIVLEHGRPEAPRADLFRSDSAIQPLDAEPEVAPIGGFVGTLRCADAEYARRVLEDEALLERLRRLRYPYVRVDRRSCGFYWAGDEADFSAMVRDHDGYPEMVLAIFDDLADLADKIEPRAE
ncbi:MAG: hypothetical protein AB1758_08500 [Candidatus Eremiobacterota bacterium]